METIGLIGAGLLGSAIAARLTGTGYTVLGYDLDPARSLGAASAAEVAKACRRVILSLPNSQIAGEVAQSIGLRRGTILIDTTTGEPGAMAATGAQLASRGIDYLDASIGGSSRQVRNGQVIIMAGGRREAFDGCHDLFTALATRAFYLGACGCGARMKLVVNLVLGLNRAVLAEGLTFARASGVDPAQALDVLKAGAAYSRAMDAKGEKMLTGDFTAEARLAQHLKDVRLILASASEHGARTPLSEAHCELLERAVAAGYGDLDNSAVITSFQAENAGA